jgi:cytidylate kinase
MMELDHRRVVAIDGPGGAGKSTVARILADRIGALLFDTGALYRAVTLAAIRQDVAGTDEARLAALAREIVIEIRPASVADGRQIDVVLNGDDVTWVVRTPEIDARVSEVSAHRAVREALLDLQRRVADGTRVVMVGRDIGTVVIPNAGAKIFLEASTEIRARRRLAELRDRGIAATFDTVLNDLNTRDAYDSDRETAPLLAADDAIRVDTDGQSIEEVVDAIYQVVVSAWRMTGVTIG